MNYNELCEKFNISLNEEQERAVRKINGPSLLISVPGSGKTTVIVTRIAYMIFCENISPHEILTVTFSVDAAKSMKNRYIEKFHVKNENEIPEFSTIHSLALKIVRTYCRKYGRIPFKILENTNYIIKKIVQNNSTDAKIKDDTLKEVINHLSKSANLMYNNDELCRINIKNVNFINVLRDYKKYKIENRLMDFDDLLCYGLRILKKYPDILEIYQNRFVYFNVDEAQDNSLVQNRIMNLLSSKNNNLFMVGDEDQCIYGFRGAYPDAFFEFTEKWGQENVIKLQTNYRSCDDILKCAEKFISQNKHRYQKRLFGVKNKPGIVKITDFENNFSRDSYISRDFNNYSTTAVLSRNNDSLISVCNVLIANSVNFNLKPGKNEFFSSFIVKDIIKILNYSVGNETEKLPLHIERILNNKNVVKYLSTLSPIEAINFIVKDMYYSKYLIAISRDGFSYQGMCLKLNILSAISESFSNIELFLERLNIIKELCEKGSFGGKISLLTCHGSKGLEFDKVYIIDAIDKIFPCCKNYDGDVNTETEYEEEVRLFYVAITRAKNEVEIMNIKKPYWGVCFPSIFVKEIQKGILE